MRFAFSPINPKSIARLYVEPCYSELHPVKSFLIKFAMIIGILMACAVILAIIIFAAISIDAPAIIMMPLVIGLGLMAGVKIGSIIFGEVR
jgi:hypothetical protein